MAASSFTVIPNGSVTSPKGFMAGSVYAGMKTPKPGVRDLAILTSTVPCVAAGTFTRNKMRAAPVTVSEERLTSGKLHAIVANSGRANACTGDQGLADARRMAALTAKKLGIAEDQVGVASTGKIGVLLPMELIGAGIAAVKPSSNGGHEFTQAIMTTDTRAKEIAVSITLPDGQITIGGAAKGAAMIHPDMGTMLGFITTDAALSPAFARQAIRHAVDHSFNMISIDGDTSTNDSVFLLANGLAGNKTIEENSPEAEIFQAAFTRVCTYLAKEIARDGEGAMKLIEVSVEGALSESDARLHARTIAGSILTKAAVAGSDPNWGRILAAAGRSGAEIVMSKVDVFVGDTQLARSGGPLPFDEKKVRDLLSQPEVLLRVSLNLGPHQATAWGCDLTQEYVALNSEYTS